VSYGRMFEITQNSPETETKNMKRKVANMFHMHA
jgi:hypothetical protein